ncbi:SDR family oxidoreductase [Natronoflexus pectinivorans]|uniref:UDP-N-acetylglucosamine 4-epimerase n=1 Tax=Natronoflexus pectinivorans TaxID=682526 RepID=A0A4R2GJZ0_9BACT|nr:SDR family oxidoreductase [Natronoflexus pectinivorans]TCO09124.1 UDP-N-acetylglucosamine 4-epimerase [Natronoflexus pectinivorans]
MRIIENSRVLVTGGAGFIGSNIIDALLQQNNEVVCLDNFSTGKRENISHHLSNPKFTLIEGDIRDFDQCRKAAEAVEIILHQAALGSVPRSINDPLTSNEVNVSGFLNILMAAKEAGVRRVVYAASSSTYGDSEELPKVEERIGKPLSPYAVTKYVNELYADVFSKVYGMELVGLRYFNVFGPRQDPNGAYAAVIPLFVKALMNKQSPKINGDGSYSRDFTYVANVVQANQLAALTNVPEAINTVYNVACGSRISLNELVIITRDLLSNYDIEINEVVPEYGSVRAGDVPHSLASIEKAEKLLGYKPTHQFADGLKEAISWYWNNLK